MGVEATPQVGTAGIFWSPDGLFTCVVISTRGVRGLASLAEDDAYPSVYVSIERPRPGVEPATSSSTGQRGTPTELPSPVAVQRCILLTAEHPGESAGEKFTGERLTRENLTDGKAYRRKTYRRKAHQKSSCRGKACVRKVCRGKAHQGEAHRRKALRRGAHRRKACQGGAYRKTAHRRIPPQHFDISEEKLALFSQSLLAV